MKPLPTLLLLLLAAAVATLLWPKQGQLPMLDSEDQDAGADDPVVEYDIAVAAPAPSLPSEGWEHPLSPNLGAWREAARADPGEAMELAIRLSVCRQALSRSIDHERSDFAQRRQRAAASGAGADVLQRMEQTQAENEARWADCSQLEAGFETEMLAWYERAARHAQEPALRSRARIAYAQNAFVDMRRSEQILAQLDEAQRRRDLARAWLLDELESGNEYAVIPWLDAIHGSSPLFPRADPVTRGAWSFVQSVIHARRGGGGAAAQAFWDDPQAGNWYIGDLDPAQVQAATDAGREHYQRLFGPPGG